ncbi:MAG: uracil-DNA glycosylase [Nitrospirae bacterium]|nr:uracil-DNA glycosylase [Nitrospirota bacterium]
MIYDLKDSLKTVLEFYKELGFERLPLNLSQPMTQSQRLIEKSEIKSQKTGYEDSCIQAFKDSSIQLDPSSDKEASLKALRDEIGGCQRCRLSGGRTNIVFGEGNADAQIMFIGEAPGRDEDIQGMPFVGEAGQILTNLIMRMGEASGLNFGRKDVYIANIVKCRPSANRDPMEDEIKACLPFLERQIEIISPKVIMSLGKISSHTLLGDGSPISKFSITRARGHFFTYKGIPAMPTFHPAYFLRNSKDKRLTWADAMLVLEKLNILKKR